MYAVTALYKFVRLSPQRVEELHANLFHMMEGEGMRGLMLLSNEGVNATVAGTAQAVDNFKRHLSTIPEFQEITYKNSQSAKMPFKRLKIDLREEIVGMKRSDLFPEVTHNNHLSPEEWHRVLSEEEDFLLIDTRNFYEYDIGKFKGAIDPNTGHFSEFPEFIEKQNYPKDKKILMYCTGGIRCEKALMYMQEQGFNNVYQLEGGILNYLEKYPEGHWEGECFIFDHRVAVDQNLNPTEQYHLCPHCGNPGKEEIDCDRCGKQGIVCQRCLDKPYRRTCSKDCSYKFEHGVPCRK